MITTTRKVISYLILILSFSVIAFGQKETNENSAKIRAQEVLAEARKAVGLKTDVSSLKGFSILYEQVAETSTTDPNITTGEPMTEKIQIDTVLSDKIKINKSRKIGMSSATELKAVNGDVYEFQLDAYRNGAPFASKYINTNRPEDAQKKTSGINSLKWDLFLQLYPITLDASWFSPLEFKFIGVAESPDGKADILEAVSSDKVEYRCFFDKETHFLLMLTKTWTTEENKEAKDTYFFSDYKKASNLMYPHKIIRQSTRDSFTIENTISSITINTNPTFKPDFFDIKEK
ncbi:MAG: hypothetical protein K1X72_11070 [Pyrinomonadaceae bacterium]|nr:hypothetical protein [Pyrinomonadaceae bacterium]